MSPLADQLWSHTVVFVVGVVIGYLVAKVELWKSEEHPMVDSAKQTVGSRVTKFSNSPWPIMIAVLAILIASVQVLVSQGQTRHVQDCLVTFTNKLHDVLEPRQKDTEALQAADTKFNDALVRLLDDALLKPAPTPAGRKTQMKTARHDAVLLTQAAQAKKDLARKLSVERATKPYPPPPKKAC